MSDFVLESVTSSGKQKLHMHMATCRHGFLGQTGCRLCKPSGKCIGTHPVLLTPKSELDEVDGAAEAPATDDPSAVPRHENELCYIASEFPLTEEPKHSLIDPLNPSMETAVPVWEIDCPPVENVLKLDPVENHSRDAILEKFEPLRQDGEFTAWKEFWEWMNALSDEKLKQFHEKVSAQLPKANGLVPSFNVIISRMTGSHNNVILLGSTSQAAAAVFYVCPYMGKSKVPLLESLIVLNDVVKNIKQHPSSAADSGTQTRTVKHLLQRTLNQLHLKMELSSHQIAAKLLSLPSFGGSLQHSYLNPIAEMAAAAIWKLDRLGKVFHVDQDTFQSRQSKSDDQSVETSSSSETNLDHSIPAGEEFGTGMATSAETFQLTSDEQHMLEMLEADLGKFKLFTVEHDEVDDTPRKEFVAMSSIYNNRGPQLKHLSRYEMAALTEVVEKLKDTEKERPDAFPMAPGFVLAANHEFRLKRKQATPIITRSFPQHPGKKPSDLGQLANWEKTANLHARFVLTVFRPEVDFHSASEQENPYEYTFEALEDWIQALQTDSNIISKFRLVLICRHVSALRTKAIVKKMSNEHRGRNRDLWDDVTQQNSSWDWTREEQNELNADATMFTLSGNEARERLRKSTFLNMQIERHRQLSPKQPPASSVILHNPVQTNSQHLPELQVCADAIRKISTTQGGSCALQRNRSSRTFCKLSSCKCQHSSWFEQQATRTF